MTVGGSGGFEVVTAIAQVVVRSMIFNETIKEAIDAPRLFTELSSNYTLYEETFPQDLISELTNVRHQDMRVVEESLGIVHGLKVEGGYIRGNCDFREGSSAFPAGF
ncbi:hypothetical protein AB6A40_008529 [Gnathostoma spinigerum]|uniref:Uncharacterized protein n=1 Tax=Gnathostoma spinigerum TaxID=75299 RepID=A0ABD6EQK9_9BILA